MRPIFYTGDITSLPNGPEILAEYRNNAKLIDIAKQSYHDVKTVSAFLKSVNEPRRTFRKSIAVRIRMSEAAYARWNRFGKRKLVCAVCGTVQIGADTGNRTKYCSRACGSKDPERNKRISEHAKARVRHGKWKDMAIYEARQLWDEWIGSGMGIVDFIASKHTSHHALVNVFRKYFPEQYESQIEFTNGVLSNKYGRGVAFEYQVRDYYMKLGYFCHRSFLSRGVADLVVIHSDEMLLIQCKIGGKIKREGREGLVAVANSIGAKPLMATKNKLTDALIISEVKP